MKRKLTSILLTAALALSLSGQAAAGYAGGAYSGLARTQDGILATDVYNKVVWLLTDSGQTVYAGTGGTEDLSGEPQGGYYDGSLTEARFASPWAIAPYLDGWAVTDAGNNAVRYIGEDGVQTAAGSATAGLRNGLGSSARFDHPTGLAADGKGNLYVADTGNNVIRKLTKSGQVTTYAEGFLEPTGLYWSDGVLYVADSGHHRICKVESGKVTVLAGGVTDQTASEDGVYEGGYVDGSVSIAKFDNPQGVAVADDGTVYVADTGNGAVRRLSDGRVSTLLAPADEADETFPVSPRGLLLEGDTLWVSDVFARELASLSLTQAQPPVFADVAADAWYAGAVDYASGSGLLTGTGLGFEPGLSMSRAMAATLVSRLYNLTYPALLLSGDSVFSDVAADAWYFDAVAWAADAGITGGTGAGFDPGRAVTRQELAVFLYRFAALTGMDTGADEASLAAFSDAGQVGDWAAQAMAWAVGKGVLAGDETGALNPQAAVTRAQTAQMLLNLSPLLP